MRRERGPRIAHYDPAEHRPLATRFRDDPEWQFCSFGHGLFGCSAIRMLRSQTSTKRSSDARESGFRFLCYGHAWPRSFSSIATAEITRQSNAETTHEHESHWPDEQDACDTRDLKDAKALLEDLRS